MRCARTEAATVTIAVLLIVVCLAGGAVVAGQSGPASGLTPAEISGGWQSLFDGKTLNGWTMRPPPARREDAPPPPAGRWAAENGELVWVKDSGRGYLVTNQVFDNFVLRLEFWVDEAANSGVNFGVPDSGNISSRTSFEVNIFDATEEFPTGSINNVQRRIAAVPATAGRWNSYEISRLGDHIVVVLNGTRVADVTTTLHPGGHIGLQAPAAGTTRFRKLRIKTG